MKLPIYQADAFTSELFGGNPAAVIPLEEWLPDGVMQNIAAENNLSETAFFVEEGDSFRLRWFTPAVEVDLCGHATLATSHVLFEELGYEQPTINFNTSEVYKSDDYMVVLNSEQEVANLDPDFRMLNEVDARGIIVTAPGDEVDFVSRFFAPQAGIDEDPVTGSAHTKTTPYWSRKLKKDKLSARQISKRGGELICEMKGDRVEISGEAVTYMKGEITLA